MLRTALARASDGRALSCNDTRAHKRVDTLARALSRDLMGTNASSYSVHGQFGIFAHGDKLVGSSNKHLHLNYAGVKVKFLFSRTCELARSSADGKLSICEIGFNAGLSSLLFLEAAPDATVHSFDLGDMPWSQKADDLLRSAYGSVRFPGVTFGDSAKTIRTRDRERPLKCDVAFIDGDKTYEGRLQSLYDARAISRPAALVFLDDLSSRACIDGSVPKKEHTRRCEERQMYATAVRAYDRASRTGLLKVRDCVWPPSYEDKDGVCTAELSHGGRSDRYLAAREAQGKFPVGFL